MDYLNRLKEVENHIRSRAIEPEVLFGEPISKEEIATVWSDMLGKPELLPSSLVDFFSSVGNGLSFRWFAADEEMGGSFEIDRLELLLSGYLRGKEHLVEFNDHYSYPHVNDSALAKKTAERMRNWLPMIQEGNGDCFCLDFGDKSNPVVFNRHDWMDGGDGNNGFVVGKSLPEFFQHWSSVCFQCPASLYWPDVFEGHEVRWQSNEFDDRFRLV